MTGAIAPTKPLTALDLCDRCGAQAYVRVLLTNGGELLFCAHHGRQHATALAKVASDIQDESNRLSDPNPAVNLASLEAHPGGTLVPSGERSASDVNEAVPAGGHGFICHGA